MVDILTSVLLVGAGLCFLIVYLYRYARRHPGSGAVDVSCATFGNCEECAGLCAQARDPDAKKNNNTEHTTPDGGKKWTR